MCSAKNEPQCNLSNGNRKLLTNRSNFQKFLTYDIDIKWGILDGKHPEQTILDNSFT